MFIVSICVVFAVWCSVFIVLVGRFWFWTSSVSSINIVLNFSFTRFVSCECWIRHVHQYPCICIRMVTVRKYTYVWYFFLSKHPSWPCVRLIWILGHILLLLFFYSQYMCSLNVIVTVIFIEFTRMQIRLFCCVYLVMTWYMVCVRF